jgi:hypothetical protein
MLRAVTKKKGLAEGDLLDPKTEWMSVADSAHRERQDRSIVSAQIGDRDHRSERSDASWWRCSIRSVSSPISYGTGPSA